MEVLEKIPFKLTMHIDPDLVTFSLNDLILCRASQHSLRN